jgi:hypothetical protein
VTHSVPLGLGATAVEAGWLLAYTPF